MKENQRRLRLAGQRESSQLREKQSQRKIKTGIGNWKNDEKWNWSFESKGDSGKQEKTEQLPGSQNHKGMMVETEKSHFSCKEENCGLVESLSYT